MPIVTVEQCHADNAHGPGRCTGQVAFINNVGTCPRCGTRQRIVLVEMPVATVTATTVEAAEAVTASDAPRQDNVLEFIPGR